MNATLTSKQLSQCRPILLPHELLSDTRVGQILLNLLAACQLVSYTGAFATRARLNQHSGLCAHTKGTYADTLVGTHVSLGSVQ